MNVGRFLWLSKSNDFKIFKGAAFFLIIDEKNDTFTKPYFICVKGTQHIASEIYKGNSKTYKGKIRKQDV